MKEWFLILSIDNLLLNMTSRMKPYSLDLTRDSHVILSVLNIL